MGEKIAVSTVPVVPGIVGINLSRLISGAKGAGGAGIFSLYLARALAKVSTLHIFVMNANRGLVERFLQKHPDVFARSVVRLISVEKYHTDLEEAAASCAIWIDPLNGLEPLVMPKNVFSVSVIHDLLFQNRPYFFSESELEYRSDHYGSAIARADMVWTVSDAERDMIETRYSGVDVRAIYQPPYYHQTHEASEFVTDKRILFYPAVQWNHKNHMGLIEAFLALCDNGEIPDDVVLLLSGVVPVEDNTRLYIEAVKTSRHKDRVIEVPYLDAAEYDAVMQGCLGHVFPSLYEGYGIPALEAAASGMPMLASAVPSLDKFEQIPSNIQIIENADDPAALYRALKQFIVSPPLRRPRNDGVFLGVDLDHFDRQVASLLTGMQSIIAGGTSKKSEISRDTWPEVTQKQPGLGVWVAFSGDTAVSDVEAQLAPFEQKLRAALPDVTLEVRPVVGSDLVNGFTPGAHAPIIHRPDGLEPILSYELIFCKYECLAVLDEGDLETIALETIVSGFQALSGKSEYNSVVLRKDCRGVLPSRLYANLEGRLLNTARLSLPLSATVQQVNLLVCQNLRDWADFEKIGVHVLDPALRDTIGHHIALAKMWLGGAGKLDYRSSIAIHQQAELDSFFPGHTVHRIFSDYLYGNVGDIGLFTHELSIAARRCGFRKGDYVFLFCATPAMLAGTIAWMLTQANDRLPTFVIRFDRTQQRTPECRLTYAEAFQRVKILGLRKHFKFYTESKGLQDYFAECSGEVMPLLFNPLPATSSDFLSTLLPKAAAPGQDSITIGYLGEARMEKGFQKIPFIVEYLLALPEFAGRLKFKIQVSIGPQNRVPEVIGAKQNLIQLARRYPCIELMESLPDDEYVRALNSLDLLLLPYDLAQYAIRGSGVATEAIAAEVPMVVGRGLDLAKTFKGVGVVEPKDHSLLAFAEATKEALGNIEALKKSILSVKQSIPGFEIEESAVIKRLVSDVQQPGAAFRGLVLLLVNDTYGEGNTAVFKSQRRYLEQQGYGVLELEIPYPNDARFTSPTDGVEWNHIMKTLSFGLKFLDTPQYRSVLARIKGFGHSYDAFWDAWKGIYIPEALRSILLNNTFAFVVVNYAHHLGVLANHNVVPKAPLVLEAHDIQAYQYAIQQERPPDPAEIIDELQKLKSFDHVVSISHSESKVMAEVAGADNVTWCLPAVAEQVSAASGRLVAQPGDFQVLFVGSSHEANVTSLRWFMQNVYEPILYAEGVKLGIVGNCGQFVNVSHMSDRVTVYGRVAELAPYYAMADVVALPVVMGAGVPIKVLDAFRNGKPFTLHSFPSKALDLPEGFPVVDNGLEMANDILSLLSDSKLSAKRARVGTDFYNRFASPSAFDSTWDGIVQKAKDRYEGRRSGKDQ